ncbi:MAG: hypothetical protein DM484_28070, partial [Candidatus Methylumidiphilus alinenensis]
PRCKNVVQKTLAVGIVLLGEQGRALYANDAGTGEGQGDINRGQGIGFGAELESAIIKHDCITLKGFEFIRA